MPKRHCTDGERTLRDGLQRDFDLKELQRIDEFAEELNKEAEDVLDYQYETGVIVMPIISMFYGIIIRMYLLDNKHHNLPHIHAKYAEYEASISIEDGEILAGQLPRKQLRLVQAWIELRRDELLADWEMAVSNENPYKIAPL